MQNMDMHDEAIEALEAALRYMDIDEPDSSRARLHYSLAQAAVATHQPELLRRSLKQALVFGQVRHVMT